jgi:hypothetical protein
MQFLKVVDFIDTPEVIDCTVTPIPASAAGYLQVVAALAETTYQIVVQGSVPEFVGLYSGAPGQERLEQILGQDKIVSIVLKKGARVSLRSMGPQVNLGEFTLQFLGVH